MWGAGVCTNMFFLFPWDIVCVDIGHIMGSLKLAKEDVQAKVRGVCNR